MSIHALLRCAAVPTGLILLLGGAMAAPEPAPEPAPAQAAPAAPAPTRTVAHPDLSGTWRLDPRASDDPAQVPGGGKGGPGGGGGHGGGGGRGPQVDPNQGRVPGEGFDGSEDAANQAAEAAGRQAAREFSELEIFHAGDEFDLTDGMQISRMLRIGGEPTDVFTPRGVVKATAAWESGALVVTESDPKGEVRRTRQFILSGDRNTLTVREIRHRPGKEGDHAMTLVYRRQTDPGRP